jgi:hypothetical protein
LLLAREEHTAQALAGFVKPFLIHDFAVFLDLKEGKRIKKIDLKKSTLFCGLPSSELDRSCHYVLTIIMIIIMIVCMKRLHCRLGVCIREVECVLLYRTCSLVLVVFSCTYRMCSLM